MTVGDYERGETEHGSGRPTGRRRPARRRLVKAGIAVAGGVALSTMYVTPGMLSIAVYETAYASGTIDGRKKGRRKPEGDDEDE